MSHTAGFTMDSSAPRRSTSCISRPPRCGAASLQELVDRVATLPLLYQPGEGWVYSVSVDIQGYLVEKLSGKPFPEFLRERIFRAAGHEGHGVLGRPKEQDGRGSPPIYSVGRRRPRADAARSRSE